MNITDVKGVEIRDSRGNPTVEVFVSVGEIVSSFQVPSGASTGKAEAYELRDEETGGMNNVLSVIEEVIKPNLLGCSVFDQKVIDEVLRKLDGTPHKTKLGGNTMIGVSIATAKCAAKVRGIELYEYLRTLTSVHLEGIEMPYLYINLINGGKHSHSELAFQEYHIVPQTRDVKEALRMTEEIIQELETIISQHDFLLTKGDEGGYAISTPDIFLPLQFLQKAIENRGFSGKVKLALDVASSSFYKEESGMYTIADTLYSSEELQSIYKKICSTYDVLSIEDPFHEEGFSDFTQYQPELSPTFFVGDDLTTTNVERIKMASEEKSIQGLIIKPNQIGTLTETIEAIMYAHDHGIRCIVSHRSGETLDTFIADLAVAYNCFGIKAGSPQASERKVKYDRLLEIASHYTHMSLPHQSKINIIATVGPTSNDRVTLTNMVQSGMDMARLNMSWATHEKSKDLISLLREIGKELNKNIPIIMDLSGPRVKEEQGHHVDSNSTIVITEKDKEDIIFGTSEQVDYFALSYVTCAQDISDLKDLIAAQGGSSKIIAKIERKEAVKDFEEIAKISDMIMIARGDLGNEYPLGEIPFVEKDLLKMSKEYGVPVIVATEMLLSTTYQATPSRAEVTDEVFAIINGADAIMLSEETAHGKFPVEAVASMEEIAVRTETYHHDQYEN